MAGLREIIGYYGRYWQITLASVVVVSVLEIIDLIVPYTLGQILNVVSRRAVDRPMQMLIAPFATWSGLPSNDPRLCLAVLLGLIFLVTVARGPIQPWLGYWFDWDIAYRARRDHLQQSLEKILSLPLEFYDDHNSGRIGGRISRGIANYTWTYPEITGQLIPKLCRVLGIFVMMWLIEPRIAGLFLISFLFILLFTLRQLKPLVERDESLEEYSENIESRTSEIITNIKTIKAFATEAAELERQRQRWGREFKVLDYRILKGYVYLNMWHRTFVETSIFAVLGVTLVATLGGEISLGHFVTLFTISSMAYGELEPISTLAETFARRYASMLRFHEFMEYPVGRDAGSLAKTSQATPLYAFTGKIEFCNLTFGYQPERPVLKDISFLVEPCQTIAIVGRSGSGKSTLVKLLCRYFEPNQGRILIDGQDIQRLDVTGYRKRLAIVHQEVDVFNGTLLNNLTYGNPSATLAQVKEACAIARVHEFAQQLPQGYKTMVGERGVRLSGGQRQRLGIARALLVNPDVLIFDEATSSLDYESERLIQRAMQSIIGTRTTIIIAHRLSTVREANQIVVLDQGHIVEVGTHLELLRQQGLYHRLHSLQEMGDFLL
ncbi:MAG: ABC transporter ATP-binding protein [Leptolyngbyaceae bacterium]|nr:ABC transporter ATP-binding protein [Leptolyngbyaceae bacterium]